MIKKIAFLLYGFMVFTMLFDEPVYAENTDREIEMAGRMTGTGSVENIRNYWEINGYPDYVSYVCDEELAVFDDKIIYPVEIGLYHATEKECQEIVELCSTKLAIKFTEADNSYAQRQDIYKELKKKKGFLISDIIHTNNSDRITVVAATEYRQLLDKIYGKKYGKMVKVTGEFTQLYKLTEENKIMFYFYRRMAIYIGIILVLTSIGVYKRKKRKNIRIAHNNWPILKKIRKFFSNKKMFVQIKNKLPFFV